jgi:uncharacterized cupin superfamily protein
MNHVRRTGIVNSGRRLFLLSLMMLHETYEPGADSGQRLCSHEGEEAGIVIAGQIEITVGDEVETLGTGDA